MVLNLLQPINTTFVPSVYPAPVAPDNFICNHHYAYPAPPSRADCQVAFAQLPWGNEPEFFSYQFSKRNPNRLPICVKHGTCEIWFHTSGEQYREFDPFVINPRDIRNMAGWILDECVSGQRTGGAITKGVGKATDWILNLRSGFPHGRMRKSPDIVSYPASTVDPLKQTLHLIDYNNNSRLTHVAPSTTFYSLNVWNNGDLITESDWNPGNFEPHLGLDIAEYVGDVAHRAPAEGAVRGELERRYELLIESVSRMEFGTEHAWWDCDRRSSSLSSNISGLDLGNPSATRRTDR